MARFQTKIIRSKSRFVANEFTPERMHELGRVIQDANIERIGLGLDVNDQPAPPLKEGYRRFKQRKGLDPIRNWRLTGRTLRSLRVLSAAHGRAVIGFTDAITGMRAAINNRRARQFGVSPVDRGKLMAELRKERTVKVEAA